MQAAAGEMQSNWKAAAAFMAEQEVQRLHNQGTAEICNHSHDSSFPAF